MGRSTFSRSSYASASQTFASGPGPKTRAGAEMVRNTGKLDPLVDPAEYGVIRRSLLRFEQRDDGMFDMTIGCSMPIETRLDTTGSMGHFVDIALAELPNLYERCQLVLPGYDVHVATGIFGDCMDDFVLNRPQFEMLAEKIVRQLTLMNPEHGGCGNGHEDPEYGIFGGAYLVAAYANCIGLKRYDFTITDEPAMEQLSEQQLKRVFGDEVFTKCKENGFDISPNDLPTTSEVFSDLLNQAHAFVLRVNDRSDAMRFWPSVIDPERVVYLPDMSLVTQVQSVIIGLTEGTLGLDQVGDFLVESKASKQTIKEIERAVANIPIGAQVPLRKAIEASGHQIPQAGNVFEKKPDVFAKTNLWPLDPKAVADKSSADLVEISEGAEGPHWL